KSYHQRIKRQNSYRVQPTAPLGVAPFYPEQRSSDNRVPLQATVPHAGPTRSGVGPVRSTAAAAISPSSAESLSLGPVAEPNRCWHNGGSFSPYRRESRA